MGSGEFVGNNMEFTVDAISDVTVYFNRVGNDSDTEKYPHASDTSKSFTAKRISIRTNQTIQLVEQNEIAFKDPLTIIINTEYRERRDMAMINSIKLRTTVAGTTIRIRWHGGY